MSPRDQELQKNKSPNITKVSFKKTKQKQVNLTTLGLEVVFRQLGLKTQNKSEPAGAVSARRRFLLLRFLSTHSASCRDAIAAHHDLAALVAVAAAWCLRWKGREDPRECGEEGVMTIR
jgi:hypothetical protein